jgi:hypothetical protein
MEKRKSIEKPEWKFYKPRKELHPFAPSLSKEKRPFPQSKTNYKIYIILNR